MDTKFYCEPCDKYYKSQSSFCNHKKRYHSRLSTHCQPSLAKCQPSVNLEDDTKQKVYSCEYCEKEFIYRQSKSRHMKKCKPINNVLIDKYEKDIADLKQMIHDLLNKNCKMHYKTLQKINNGNINNGNINTGTINNTINIMALGHENINDVLTKAEKISILNKKENALPYMIEMVHFNDKYPQFKNVAITNSRSKHAYLYDTTNKVFKLVDKDELVEELIDYRVCDIEEYYLAYKNELELPVKNKIEELIRDRGDDDNTKDRIKLLLFNNRHKITV